MFYSKIAKIHNSGQSRSIVVCGNVYDVFWNGKEFVPLIQYICDKAAGLVQLVYELNGPIRMKMEDRNKLKNAWIQFKSGEDPNTLLLKELKSSVEGKQTKVEKYSAEFESNCSESIGNPTTALEFLRQLSLCSRKILNENLLIIVEAADMLLPSGNGDVASLNDKQLHRISIVQDWLGDPHFINGHDTVILIAESRSLIHPRISKLPQVLSVEVASPSTSERKQFLENSGVVDNLDQLAELTAGLNLFALRQLIKGAEGKPLDKQDIVAKVEEFIQAQLGEDVVEFKKPTHTLDDCIGFTKLKKFLRNVLIPRMQIKGDGILPGAAVAGAIGGGKTFIFEALANELDMPVLVLKNIRSQWFGQTDVVIERFKRVLEALDKALILVDEADTQFGGVGEGTHETERRLTGKIQGMMSDPALKGKIYWLLMTARIHLLSPDIRRPGRVGDLIIPVLDPVGEDRVEFIKWALKSIKILDNDADKDESLIKRLNEELAIDFSSASFASLRSNLKYKKVFQSVEDLFDEVRDFIQPAISQTRRYQTLQALVNCTRRSLLPDPKTTDSQREEWETEIMRLEALGIK